MENHFVHYPEIDEEDFYETIYWKKEFFDTRIVNRPEENTIENICDRNRFELQNHQEFGRNFISPETPYTGMLVFHGTGTGKTCLGLNITEGLKEHVVAAGKKIYIIASKEIRKGFMNTLYNFEKEQRERANHLPIGSLQCVGKNYYLPPEDFTGENAENTRKLAIQRKILKHYKFLGPGQFSNLVDKKVASDQIGDFFANSVILVDEAHNIAGVGKLEKGEKAKTARKKLKQELQREEEIVFTEDVDDDETETLVTKTTTGSKTNVARRPLLHVLKDIGIKVREFGGQCRMIMMTATPMKDNHMELADLLEVLRTNDGLEFDRSKLFPHGKEEQVVNEDYLYDVARGYVSYLRGNDPVSFPEMLWPEGKLLYEPRPEYTIRDKPVDYRFKVDEGVVDFKLYHCPMNLWQYRKYLEIVNQSGGIGRSEITLRQASNIIFPTLENSPNVGNVGFSKTFASTKMPNSKGKQFVRYDYLNHIRQRAGRFLQLGKLERYSQKLVNFINAIDFSGGITFSYSEFIQTGALLQALSLEENGYIRYVDGLSFDSKGRISNEDEIPECRLFEPPTEKNDRRYKCSKCGKFYQPPNPVEAHNPDCTGFSQATYLIYTGDIGNIEDFQFLNMRGNLNGGKIKVILGTRVTSEGIDFHRIRQIHIFDPWHNNTRIYQAIGRGIRFCSHIALPKNKQNVTVFKYSSTVPLVNIDDDTGEIDIPDERIEYTDQQQGVDGDSGNLTDDIDEKYVGKYSREEIFNKIENGEITQPSDDMVLADDVDWKIYLGETIDERIYYRTINKDIFTKRLERILKEVAIDCALNKRANIYMADIDYSRECDYQKCQYTCAWEPEYDEKGVAIGTVNTDTYNIYFSKPQIKKAKNAVLDLFKTGRSFKLWQIVDHVLEKHPAMDELYIYHALDIIIGKSLPFKPDTVFDYYNRAGHIIVKGEYYVFQPKVLSDTSAPLHYRDKPMKNKVRFLNLKEFIESITRQKVTPFGIYRVERQIPQIEQEVDEERPQSIGYLNMIDVNIAPRVKIAFDTYEDEDDRKNKLEFVAIELRKNLDRVLISNQVELYEKFYKWYHDEDETGRTVDRWFAGRIFRMTPIQEDPDYAKYLEIIFRQVKKYYDEQQLLFDFTYYNKQYVGHHIGGPILRSYNSETKTFEDITSQDDENLYTHYVETEYQVERGSFVHSNDYNYGFLYDIGVPLPFNRDSVNNFDLTMAAIELARSNEKSVKKFNTFGSIATDAISFKINLMTGQKIKITEAGRRSLRSMPKGKACKSYDTSQIALIIDYIIDVLQRNGREHPPESDPGPKKCSYVETLFRLADYYRIDDQRWFFNRVEYPIYFDVWNESQKKKLLQS